LFPSDFFIFEKIDNKIGLCYIIHSIKTQIYGENPRRFEMKNRYEKRVVDFYKSNREVFESKDRRIFDTDSMIEQLSLHYLSNSPRKDTIKSVLLPFMEEELLILKEEENKALDEYKKASFWKRSKKGKELDKAQSRVICAKMKLHELTPEKYPRVDISPAYNDCGQSPIG
jgi:hypothetical protein